MTWKSELQQQGDHNKHKKRKRVIHVNGENTWEYGRNSDTIIYAKEMYNNVCFILCFLPYAFLSNNAVNYSKVVNYSIYNIRTVCTLKD